MDASPGSDHSRTLVCDAEQTKIEWAREHARDPALLQQFEVDVLPALSVANVRALLRATMPLPQLTLEEANALVIKHLVNRTRSRRSRMKSMRKVNTRERDHDSYPVKKQNVYNSCQGNTLLKFMS